MTIICEEGKFVRKSTSWVITVYMTMGRQQLLCGAFGCEVADSKEDKLTDFAMTFVKRKNTKECELNPAQGTLSIQL